MLEPVYFRLLNELKDFFLCLEKDRNERESREKELNLFYFESFIHILYNIYLPFVRGLMRAAKRCRRHSAQCGREQSKEVYSKGQANVPFSLGAPF